MNTETYSSTYLQQAIDIASRLNPTHIEDIATKLRLIRDGGGRLFFIGVGGGAGHASHAVNDFRKICGFEAYAPTDNISELTARINDDGWSSSFASWLKGSRLCNKDALFVFSVGGGNKEKNISTNIVAALELAKEVGAAIFGIVGRDGGYTAMVADACVIVPTVTKNEVTQHTEAFQAVVWHLLVGHPLLKMQEMKWEAVK